MIRDIFWIPRSVEIAKSIRAEAHEPVEQTKEPPGSGQDQQRNRIQEVRERMARGENVFEAGRAGAAGAAADAAEEQEAPDPLDAIPEELRPAVKVEKGPDSQPGDPPNSYRDDRGRLREVGSARFLPDPGGASVVGEQADGAQQPGKPEPLAFEYARPGREATRIPVQSREHLDTLVHLQNRAMAGDEVRRAQQEIQTATAELDALTESIRTAPQDFVLGNMQADQQEALAAAIIRELPPDAFVRVIDQIDQWREDPVTRREQSLDARERRIQTQREAGERARTTESEMKVLGEIHDAVEAVVPADWPDVRADDFVRFAGMKLRDWARVNKRHPTGAETAELLASLDILSTFGIQPNGSTPAGSRIATPAPAARTKAAADEGAIERARQLPKALQAKTAARREAAAIAPGGASAGPTRTPLFEPGQHLRDRIRSARQALLGR